MNTRNKLEYDLTRVLGQQLDLVDFVEAHLDELYEKHADEMPYGVMKARTGDPVEWLMNWYEWEYNL